MIRRYLDLDPQVHETAYVDEASVVIGDVHLGPRVSIWPTTVLRGDQGRLVIGADSNVQDGSVVHATGGLSTTSVGRRVTIGHKALIHGCTIEDDCLIGMGAIVLDNAAIGRGSVVGAGALVLANSVIPPGSLVLGSPAKVRGQVSDELRAWIEHSWRTYVRLGQDHTEGVAHDEPEGPWVD